jgi:hypothetical protein
VTDVTENDKGYNGEGKEPEVTRRREKKEEAGTVWARDESDQIVRQNHQAEAFASPAVTQRGRGW